MKISLGSGRRPHLEERVAAGVEQEHVARLHPTPSAAMISCSVWSTPATRGPGGGPGRRGRRAPARRVGHVLEAEGGRRSCGAGRRRRRRRPSAPRGRRWPGSRCSRRAPRRRRRRRRTRRRLGERSPLGRVLQRRVTHVVGPHVDVLGVPEVLHLAHVDVVEGGGVPSMSSVGAADRRGPALVRTVPPGKSSGRLRQKPDAGPDLADALQDLLRREQVDAPQLVASPQSPQVEPSRRRCPTARHALQCTDRLP